MKYLDDRNQKAKLIGTDIVDRQILPDIKDRVNVMLGDKFDFLNDEYEKYIGTVDWVIINPPFKHLEDFFIKSYKFARKGLIMFCRINYLEGISRFNNIHSQIKPTKIFGYVDRVSCYKNGIECSSGVQFHSWVYYDKQNSNNICEYEFLRKYNKDVE